MHYVGLIGTQSKNATLHYIESTVAVCLTVLKVGSKNLFLFFFFYYLCTPFLRVPTWLFSLFSTCKMVLYSPVNKDGSGCYNRILYSMIYYQSPSWLSVERLVLARTPACEKLNIESLIKLKWSRMVNWYLTKLWWALAPLAPCSADG